MDLSAFIIFLLYPLGEVVAAGLLLSTWRRNRRHLRKAATLLFVLHTALFVLAFVHFSMDPYFDDNGSREFVPWGERWAMALFELALVEPFAGPALFLGYTYLARDPETPPPSAEEPDGVE